MKIIEKAGRVTVKQYSFTYEWDNEKGSGFSFPCDKDGNILTNEMPPEALANLAKCQNGKFEKLTCLGVRDDSYTYRQGPIGLCECGERVELDYNLTTIECRKCGRLYNSCGQELAPRCQWEEPMDEEPGLFSDDDIEAGTYY